jgi:hypothetical protein
MLLFRVFISSSPELGVFFMIYESPELGKAKASERGKTNNKRVSLSFMTLSASWFARWKGRKNCRKMLKRL